VRRHCGTHQIKAMGISTQPYSATVESAGKDGRLAYGRAEPGEARRAARVHYQEPGHHHLQRLADVK
jgi:hypothetical protein